MVNKPTYEELEKRVRELELELADSKNIEQNSQKGLSSRERFLENMEDSYWEMDLKGNLLYVNQAVINNYGIVWDDSSLLKLRDLSSDKTAEDIRPFFVNIYNTEKPDRMIVKHQNKKISGYSDICTARCRLCEKKA